MRKSEKGGEKEGEKGRGTKYSLEESSPLERAIRSVKKEYNIRINI